MRILFYKVDYVWANHRESKRFSTTIITGYGVEV